MLKRATHQFKIDSIQYLSSLSRDRSKLSTKIAMRTFGQRNSYLFDTFLLLMEYFQLISQSFLSLSLSTTSDQNSSFKIVINAVKLLNPGSWLELDAESALTRFALITLALIAMFKYFILLYVIAIAKLDLEGFGFILSIWRWTFKAHGRVLCFFITSACFKIISATSQEGFDNFGIGRINLLIVSITIIIFEYSLSFCQQIWFNYILPSKNILACKTYTTQMLTLLQKLVIQIFQTILMPNTLSTSWILTTLSFLFCLLRDGDYFLSLPLYNFKALLYKSGLLMVVTSLNLSCLAEITVRSFGYETQIDFVFIIWVILAVLMVKISAGYLNKIIINLINSDRGSPEYLTHKISVIKYLRKQKRIPSSQHEKYELPYLLNAAVHSCIKSILCVNLELAQNIAFNIYSKASANKLFLCYLESLLIRFPNSSFLKLYAAYFYAEKLQQYGASIKFLSGLKNSLSEKDKLNTDILMYKMQTALLLRGSKGENNAINISEYITSITTFAQLKQKMLEQAEMQNKIIKEILNDTPNLQNIYRYGQIIDTCIVRLDRKIRITLGTIPDNYIEPLMIFAHYSYSLNHSLTDYLSYYKKYSQRLQKYEKSFKFDKLIKDNLYQDTNALIIISGQKTDNGKIIYCSKPIEKIYGNRAESYIGTNISSLTAPSLQGFFAAYFKRLAEKGEQSLIRNVTRGFGYHAEGYIKLVDFYIDFHPFVTQDFCFNIIARQVPTDKELILLLENGDIECSTEKIGHRLGLMVYNELSSTSVINIRLICGELSRINHAFNMIASPEKFQSNIDQGSQKEDRRGSKAVNFLSQLTPRKSVDNRKIQMSREEAEKLYSQYISEGGNLEFSSINKDYNQENLCYKCKVENVFYDSLLVKKVTLEEIFKEQVDKMEDNLTRIAKKSLLGAYNKEETSENKISEDDESETESEEIGSGDSNPPEENQNGWIDFNVLESKRPVKMIRLYNSGENTPTAQFEGFATSERQLFTSFEPKISTPVNKISIFHEYKKINKSLSQKEPVAKPSKDPNKTEFIIKKSVKMEGSVAASQSKNTQSKKISLAIKAALATKYYPTSFKVLCLLFYILLIVIFSSISNLKGTLDRALDFIKTSKEIVNSAELRNFLLVTIQHTIRLISDLIVGKLNSQNMHFFILDPKFYSLYLNIYFTDLAKTNQDLFTITNSLDEETRRNLFTRDVRIFETYYDEPNQTYSSFDNFQAISRITETGMKILNLLMTNMLQSKREMHFLIRNSVNDLLLKNEMTSDLLMESVNSRQNQISLIVNVYLIFSLSLLAIFSITFIWIVWKQFKREKSNIIAITKMNTQMLKDIVSRISEFKKILNNEKHFEDEEDQIIPNPAKKFTNDGYSKENVKKDQAKSPILTGIINKYWTYAISLIILVTCLAGLISWHSIWNKNSMDMPQIKQSQFFFINRLKSQLTLAVAISQELFAENGTTYTHNQLNSDEFPKTIQNIIIMKNNITKIFMNEDLSYDPQIYEILFNDGCVYVHGLWQPFCELVKAEGKKTSLMYIVTELITLFQEAHEKFISSDKSTQSLANLEAQNLESVTLANFVAGAQCDLLAQSIGQILENDILTMMNRRNTSYLVFTFTFILFSILIWILVINPLREADNRFKKTLKAFPANIILTSFLLKSFLLKTSKDALNSVKNEI